MAARDDTTALKDKLKSGDKSPRDVGTTAASTGASDRKEPDLKAPGGANPADSSMSANLAETDNDDEGGNASSDKPEMPTAVLKSKDLIEAVETSEWQVAGSSVDYEDPLVRCLSILAGLVQRPISSEALKAGLPHANEAFTPELAVRAAERAGLTARVVRRPRIAKILPVTLPCILLLKGGNCCVLQNVSRGQADILLSEAGGTAKSVPVAELQEQFTGYAIFARAEARFDERAPENKLVDPRAWDRKSVV